MNILKKVLSIITISVLGLSATTANAQDNPRRGFNNGVAAFGSDMWTQAMSGLRLFTPHRDDCNATTEVFVKVYENSNSVDFGFCIDKDENSAGALHWEDARHQCLSEGKRLPQPGEWKYSCDSVAGLNNMTDDFEWAQNFVQFIRIGSNNHILAMMLGNGACNKTQNGGIAYQVAVSTNAPFRCVR